VPSDQQDCATGGPRLDGPLTQRFAAHNAATMVDRKTFDRIKQQHGGYSSWAVWAEATDKPKANIGDLRILDPEQNPTLLQTLRNDVIMIGLNISRPFSETFRNFHDSRPESQDYKIRYAFAGTPYYGAYMTDVIKGVVMVESGSLMRYLRANPSVVSENVEKLLGEFIDLKCDKPTIVAFGRDAHRLVASSVPAHNYSRLLGVTHYSHRISKDEYRQLLIKQL
jgi:hypothetical protein